MRRAGSLRAALAALVLIACARSGEARAACVAIVGAQVWLPGGRAEVTDVVLEGDTIRSVGAADATGCARVDARGKVLTAGLVDAWSGLGLVGVELEASTVDLELRAPWQDDDRLVRAAQRASLAYDTRSLPLAVARGGGVTSALVVPRGGIIAGQGLWVDLAGGRAEAIQRDPAVMVAAFRPHATAAHVLDLTLREAALWAKVRDARLAMRHPGLVTKDLDLEALGPVVTGALPLAVSVDRAADIESLLALTEGTKVRLVIVGGAEAWLVKEALARRGVGVVVDPLLNAPYGFDQLHARGDNAAVLAAAGVTVMMSTFNPHQARKLRQVAGNAVRAGMPWEAALVAITEAPAKVLGLTRHGRIEARALANIALWSADPLELSTRLERLWIHGVDVPLRSRQTDLLERYRKL